MRIVNIRLILSVFLVLSTGLVFAERNLAYVGYIEQWRRVAQENQVVYGVPASITLAQGLLESQAGQSELALKAKNHFGIKCTGDWTGDSYTYDDDRKGECFRKYTSAEQSFRDHAKFLKRSRYASCFEIPVTDYAAWAKQLRACGYATDPQYAKKLIRLIEEYDLASAVMEPIVPTGAEETSPTKAASSPVVRVAETTVLSAYKERRQLLKTHPVERINGRRCFRAAPGDTYASLAYRLNMTERKLRRYNDALGLTLQPGEIVFMKRKRAQPRDRNHTHVMAQPGQTLRDVSQQEGIRLRMLRIYNRLESDVQFTTEFEVVLSPVKEKEKLIKKSR